MFICSLQRRAWMLLSLLALLLALALPLAAQDIGGGYTCDSSSFLGGSATDDSVFGSIVQSDGTIVLAANISSATPGGLTPILLNGATISSPGAILRLSSNGRTVLSVTRLASKVTDLAVDSSDNLYVAAWDQGLIKLNASASSMTWQRTFTGMNVWRADAGPAGNCVALAKSNTITDPDKEDSGSGTIYVYNTGGTLFGSFAGYRNTLDVTIDEASQTVVHVGWRQASAWDGTKTQPVQISYTRGQSYTGTVLYTGYDWSTDTASDRFINKPTNNMADTRGKRCCIGADGKLYVAFQCAGGNHIFRYSPYDIMQTVSIVGGDKYHLFYDSKSDNKTFFARYEPSTGAYLMGQQFCGRLSDGSANSAEPRAIWADAQGRVYLGGVSASGLPLTWLPANTGTYSGGAWLLIMSPQMNTRLLCTRIAPSSTTRSLYARVVAGADRIVMGGKTPTSTETYLYNPIQGTMSTSNDGFFTVIGTGVGNIAPTVSITSPANNATFTAPASVTINATAADSDGTVSKVEFYNGATLLNTDTTSPYSYTWTGVAVGSYSLTAKAYDNAGAITTSAAVNITVNPANVPPTVSITAPANGAVVLAPASVAISATAADTDGSVMTVEFYNGATLLNTDNTSPYSYTWTGVAAGTYSLTAKAYDNAGAITTSAPVTVIVWGNQDIGAVGAAGSSTLAAGLFTVRGSGADIWGTVDEFQYAYRTLTGDGSIIARVPTVQNTNSWAKAGVMIRSTLAANSPHIDMLMTPTTSNGGNFQYRLTASATTASAKKTGIAPPYWVKAVRTGNTFAGYTSPDGITWTQVGTAQTITMASTVYIGLAVTSHADGTVCTATMDNVSVVGAP